MPPVITALDLDRAGIRTVLWATGYRLGHAADVPRIAPLVEHRQVYPAEIEQAGLYAIRLPWLHSEPSSVFADVGADAAHVVEHIAARLD